MKRVVFTNNRYMTKTQYKTLRKIEDELEKEMIRQVNIVLGCSGIALYENWNWRKKRISRLFNEMYDTWRKKTREESMIGICEKETGITLSIPEYEGDYRDLKYFQGDSKIEDLSIEQRIYMRQRQKKWIGAEVFASMIVGLHRAYGFGDERITRVYEQIIDVRDRYEWSEKTITAECKRITDVEIVVE